jgi:hypothetical protein
VGTHVHARTEKPNALSDEPLPLQALMPRRQAAIRVHHAMPGNGVVGCGEQVAHLARRPRTGACSDIAIRHDTSTRDGADAGEDLAGERGYGVILMSPVPFQNTSHPPLTGGRAAILTQ